LEGGPIEKSKRKRKTKTRRRKVATVTDMKQGRGKEEGVWLYFPTFGGTITST
jgi:hypothetical protein